MKRLINKKHTLKSKKKSKKNIKKIIAVIKKQIVLVKKLQKKVATMPKATKIDLSATLKRLNEELAKFTAMQKAKK
jgi:small-conductance mechanosensitive channel